MATSPQKGIRQSDIRAVLGALREFQEKIAPFPLPALHMETATAISMIVEAAHFDGVIE